MIFFSSKSFEKNPNGWTDSLRLNYFLIPKITPDIPGIIKNNQLAPLLKVTSVSSYLNAVFIDVLKDNPSSLKAFKVYAFKQDDLVMDRRDTNNIFKIVPTTTGREQVVVPQFGEVARKYAISCIFKDNSESEMNFLR
jgi:hypothetical protein